MEAEAYNETAVNATEGKEGMDRRGGSKQGKSSKTKTGKSIYNYDYQQQQQQQPPDDAPGSSSGGDGSPASESLGSVPVPAPAPSFYAGSENYYYYTKSAKAAKSGGGSKSAKAYEAKAAVKYSAANVPMMAASSSSSSSDNPLLSQPIVPASNNNSVSSSSNDNAGRCAGTPCTVKSWCRSRYGTCGPGRLYCNDVSRWTRSCGGEAPTTTFLTAAQRDDPEPPAVMAVENESVEDESANFLSSIEPDNFVTTGTNLLDNGGEESYGVLPKGKDPLAKPQLDDLVGTLSDTEGGLGIPPSSSSTPADFPPWAVVIFVLAVALPMLAAGVFANRRKERNEENGRSRHVTWEDDEARNFGA